MLLYERQSNSRDAIQKVKEVDKLCCTVLPIITDTTINISPVFGYGSIRGKDYGEFADNTRHSFLYDALVLLGEMIVLASIPCTCSYTIQS